MLERTVMPVLSEYTCTPTVAMVPELEIVLVVLSAANELTMIRLITANARMAMVCFCIGVSAAPDVSCDYSLVGEHA